MTTDFRSIASKHLNRAKPLLESGDEAALVHAALELRMSMEAIVYGYAQSYAEELPPLGHETWQPKRILQLLLEIDPSCGKDVTIAAGVEEQYGVPASHASFAGKEKRLTLQDVKGHYDRLGAFLHIPTIAQFASGRSHSLSKLQAHCAELIETLDNVLASIMFNITFGVTSHFDCLRCSRVLIKRITHLSPGDSISAQCPHCRASYMVTREDANQVAWKKANQTEIPCANAECGKTFFIWQDEVEQGRRVKCPCCEQRSIIVYGVEPVSRPDA